jgi:hypothetical protein
LINVGLGATPSTAPIWLRVERSGNNWTLSYALTEGNWVQAGTTQSVSINVNRVGVFAGNSSGFQPAHTARFDYFRKTAP